MPVHPMLSCGNSVNTLELDQAARLGNSCLHKDNLDKAGIGIAEMLAAWYAFSFLIQASFWWHLHVLALPHVELRASMQHLGMDRMAPGGEKLGDGQAELPL